MNMAHKKPMKLNMITKDLKSKRLRWCKDSKKYYSFNIKNVHVFVSPGNSKTGVLVPSISLIPVDDCGNCKKCSGYCYDLRNDCCYPETCKTRGRNSALFDLDPDRYFEEIANVIKGIFCYYFRWHVGGDIKNIRYLQGMIDVAIKCPNVKFLCFTKMFDIVNGYLGDSNKIPANLQIVFSAWPGLEMPNPYNLPTAHPLFADGTTTAHEWVARYCNGNCSECAYNSDGCWVMKPGDEVIFPVH